MRDYTIKVQSSIRWRPEKVGDFLEGIYVGEVEEMGPYGRYTKHLFRVKNRVYYTVGHHIDECFDLLSFTLDDVEGRQMRLTCTHIDVQPTRTICSYDLEVV